MITPKRTSKDMTNQSDTEQLSTLPPEDQRFFELRNRVQALEDQVAQVQQDIEKIVNKLYWPRKVLR